MLRDAYNGLAVRFRGLPRPVRYLLGALAFVVLAGVLYGLYVGAEGIWIGYQDRRFEAIQTEHRESMQKMQSDVDRLKGRDDEKQRQIDALAAEIQQVRAEQAALDAKGKQQDANLQNSGKAYRDARGGRSARPASAGDALLRELQEFNTEGDDRK